MEDDFGKAKVIPNCDLLFRLVPNFFLSTKRSKHTTNAFFKKTASPRMTVYRHPYVRPTI